MSNLPMPYHWDCYLVLPSLYEYSPPSSCQRLLAACSFYSCAHGKHISRQNRMGASERAHCGLSEVLIRVTKLKLRCAIIWDIYYLEGKELSLKPLFVRRSLLGHRLSTARTNVACKYVLLFHSKSEASKFVHLFITTCSVRG